MLRCYCTSQRVFGTCRTYNILSAVQKWERREKTFYYSAIVDGKKVQKSKTFAVFLRTDVENVLRGFWTSRPISQVCCWAAVRCLLVIKTHVGCSFD